MELGKNFGKYIKNFKKYVDIYRTMKYTIINIPATPLTLRVNAHFGQVFYFLFFSVCGGAYENI